MGKTVTICFRTTGSLKSALEEISAEDRRSVSSTIENILYEHLEKRRGAAAFQEEKRRFPRKSVAVPALISGAGHGQAQAGVIVDLSLGGLRISMPGGLPLEIRADGENAGFSVVFTLPHVKEALTVCAVPRHMFRRDGETGIGMSFVDASPATYQALRRYLGE